MNMKRQLQRLIIAAILAGGVLLWQKFTGTETVVPSISHGELTVPQAESQQLSGVMLTLKGEVVSVLADDNEGSRHQRFIVKVPSGGTVLVAHNIDLAPRAPVSRGDIVTVHGQYEWNDRGGVIHWTHHDPAGRHEEGWIELKGHRYE